MVARCFVEGGLHYRSTDQAGNIGETKREEVKIDRTAPVARIGLDSDTRGIVVSGSDEPKRFRASEAVSSVEGHPEKGEW